MAAHSEDRLFNPNGRKHFRRTYSRAEVRYSLLALGTLAAIVIYQVLRRLQPETRPRSVREDGGYGDVEPLTPAAEPRAPG